MIIIHIYSSQLSHVHLFKFWCCIFLTFSPQRFCVTALVGEYVPNFSHVFFWVFVSGGAHLPPLYVLIWRYQKFPLVVVLRWPRLGRPFYSFLALGCGGCALTFTGIIACVASVSVQFRSKERGTRVNLTSRQMAQVKERGGGGKESKETLADKPRDFENHPLGLSCLSSRTDIWCCHQLS